MSTSRPPSLFVLLTPSFLTTLLRSPRVTRPDYLSLMDPVTAEKNTAMFRYNLLQKVTVLFRLVEALVLTSLGFWSSAHAAGLFRHVIPVLLGPRFLFLLANAIVLSLLLLHSRCHATAAAAAISDEDISTAFAAPQTQATVPSPSAAREEEEVAFEDKRVVSVESHVRRTCKRSRSDRTRVRRRTSPELRRLKTDVGKEKVEEEEEGDEEFRRTIEAFIETHHWKFQEEESMAMAIVAAN